MKQNEAKIVEALLIFGAEAMQKARELGHFGGGREWEIGKESGILRFFTNSFSVLVSFVFFLGSWKVWSCSCLLWL